MEQILLKDTGIHNYLSGFYNTFGKLNITTVAQVLDDDLMLQVLVSLKEQYRKDELLGFIDLIKYDYQGVALPTDFYLEQKLIVEKKQTLDGAKNIYRFPVNYFRMGFSKKQCFRLESLINKMGSDGLIEENITLIDTLKKMLTVGYLNTELTHETKISAGLKNIIRKYISSYDKTHNELETKENESDIISFLKDQLKSLVETRNSIDNQIVKIKEQIAALEDNESKGRGI